jgi:hypothetical protein
MHMPIASFRPVMPNGGSGLLFPVAAWTDRLDGHLWRILGTYHRTLKRNADNRAVTSLRRIVTEEIGDRGLVAKAIERTKGH